MSPLEQDVVTRLRVGGTENHENDQQYGRDSERRSFNMRRLSSKSPQRGRLTTSLYADSSPAVLSDTSIGSYLQCRRRARSPVSS